MPARDGRGPLGEGPLTGRGFGTCAVGKGKLSGVRPMGFGGRGRGMGAGMRVRPRNGFCGITSSSDPGDYRLNEKARLESYISTLESNLVSMKERLKYLSNEEES